MTDTSLQRTNPTGMELLAELSRKTDDPQVAVAVAKAAVDLQIQMDRFNWERQDRQAKIDFDDALKRCQEKIGRIAPNRTRENNIGWADYAELDRVLRPIFTAEGFSISYSESETLREGKVLICATLSRSGQNRQFFQSVTPAGNSKMNAADIEASGQSRAQRYLLLKIFNVAVGIDAIENAPYEQEEIMDEGAALDCIASIESAASEDEVWERYIECLRTAGVPDNIVSDLNAGKPVNVVDSAKYPKEAKMFVEAKNKQLGKVKKQAVRR